MRVHPFYFILPTAVSASFAFMFPVATLPNALVFAYGDVRVVDMVSAAGKTLHWVILLNNDIIVIIVRIKPKLYTRRIKVQW